MYSEYWLVFAILTPILWSGSNVLDKIVIHRYGINPIVPQIVTGFVVMPILGIASFVLVPINNISYLIVIFSLIAGTLLAIGSFTYLKVLETEEPSRTMAIFSTMPLFVLLIVWMFWNETFGLPVYAGIILAVIGSIVISLKKVSGKKIRLRPRLFLMIIVTLFFGIFFVLSKIVDSDVSVWNFISLYSIGYVATTLVLVLSFSKHRVQLSNIHKIKRKRTLLIIMSRFLMVAGHISIIIAMTGNSVSVVSSFVVLTPAFILLYAILFGFFRPKLLDEMLRGEGVMIKIIAIFTIIFGIIIVVNFSGDLSSFF